jgi:leader peptidase (prepilin peptidase)/N-methyltransferase
MVAPIGLPFVLLAGVFGLMVGSFLNVCIHRLPRGESVVAPRSRCPSCGAPIRWYDNVPIVSYLVLRGRCRNCRAPIGVRYLAIEIVTGGLFAANAAVFGLTLVLAPRLLLSAVLVALFAIDLEHQILPNVLTLPSLAIGLACSIVLPPGLLDALAGVILGGGVLLVIRWVWLRASGVDAMGLGDVKMLAMVGAFLGWEAVLLVLFLASLTGAAVGVTLAAVGRGTMKTRLPFGTFLGAATVIAALWGTSIVRWYVGLY